MPSDGSTVRRQRGECGKWSQRRRATGSAAARPLGRKQPRSLSAEREWLLERLATKPDVTLRALVEELGERGVMTSYGSTADTLQLSLDGSDSSTRGARPDRGVVRHRRRRPRRTARPQPKRAACTAWPHLKRLRAWLEATLPKLPRKSDLPVATRYARSAGEPPSGTSMTVFSRSTTTPPNGRCAASH